MEDLPSVNLIQTQRNYEIMFAILSCKLWGKFLMQQSITYIPNNTGMMTMSKKPEHLIWELSFENWAVLIVWYHSIATGLLLFSCQAMFDSL